MKAKIHLDSELLEEISVANGLRQGCCMAHVLFNLYTTLLIERWRAGLAGVDGIGVIVKSRFDKKLFRRHTRNATESRVTECLFATFCAEIHASSQNQCKILCKACNF